MNEAKACGFLARAGWDVKNGYLYELETRRRSGVSDTVLVVSKEKLLEGRVCLEGVLSGSPLHGIGEHIRIMASLCTPSPSEDSYAEVHVTGTYGGVQYMRETKTRGMVMGFTLETEEGRIPVFCFGTTAEYLAKRMKEGDFLYVEGRIQSRKYKNRQRQWKVSHEVAAWHIERIGQ